MRQSLLITLLVVSAGLIVSCGPGTPVPFIAAATATPSAAPTAPASVIVRPQVLSFYAIGAAYAQTIAASQGNYAGTFTVTTHSCSGIATISGAGSTFTVTPEGAGACTFTVTGEDAQFATLTVDVTTTTIGGS